MVKLKVVSCLLVVVVYMVLSELAFLDYLQKMFQSPKKYAVDISRRNYMYEGYGDVHQTKGQNKEGLPLCPMTSPLLRGGINLTFPSELTLAKVEQKYPHVEHGGRYRPHDCQARHHTAIIIPHRDREHHLKLLLYHLHPFLQRQQLDYSIYVIHQAGNFTFNKARLMNAGVREAMQEREWECLFFHDVDLIPIDDRNIYVCGSNPKHAAVAINKFGFKLPYDAYFGGVTAFTPQQYRTINGFPNNYWGWGCEDDDIGLRVYMAKMRVQRPSLEVGRYKMIRHNHDKGNSVNRERSKYLVNAPENWKRDGLNKDMYEVISRERLPLYTNITVNVGTPTGLHPPP
ncbi:beta-1,4-galactosyltransferase 3-like [Nerophis lumbriciformis]|uniref:beta-1,4-galactosyltransferase 3-like n=1 Tax=Nerophis lumbriciformis TaxID=546530 RepID=UPI002ADF5874|nr:beta-1,4-galactosyltransferase 3-like [Nerophis lumbriciformis]